MLRFGLFDLQAYKKYLGVDLLGLPLTQASKKKTCSQPKLNSINTPRSTKKPKQKALNKAACLVLWESNLTSGLFFILFKKEATETMEQNF